MAKERKISRKSSRPPVVVVLGHVDHGKTTLLSKIKEIDLTKPEHGGITQHIGAYQVKSKDKTITFIDTPGHEAFSEMRSRGARVADMAILVIAADEGVKPQALESLKYIKKAKIPYLVAINKIDKPNIDLDWIKKDMAKNDILVEGYGGKIVSIPISAKTGKGIDELLEMILLLAEMEEIKGNPRASLEAVVIESKLDSHRGSLATVLVRNGSLRIGDQIEADGAFAKIKAMFNENGQSVKMANPGKPVEILGFKTVPSIGSFVKRTEKLITSRAKQPNSRLAKKEKTEEEKLPLIVKADVNGTLEAILVGLPQELEIINSNVGEVNESDVLLAETTGAEIIAFNVKISGKVKKLAETEKVKLNHYQVIYELFEDIEEKVKRFAKQSAGEEILGKAEILKEFEINKKRIAGCRVIEGEVKKTDRFHLMHRDKLIDNCRIKSMKRGKEDVEQAKVEEEFGAVLSPRLDFNLGDVLVSYKKVESNG